MDPRRFDAVLASLAPIRALVGGAASTAGLAGKEAYRLVLAVDEIATNIVTHGYQENGLKGVIDITAATEDGWLRVTIEDDAVPYDPRQQVLPSDDDLAAPLEQRPVGGLGVMLSLAGVDEFDYARVGSRNRNILSVRLPAPSADTEPGKPGHD